MAKQIYTNNASATLASSATNTATSLVLATGKGALFASPSGGDWQMVTLASSSAVEIVKVTARSGDTLTVVRGQEGTPAVAWASGAKVEARLTAGMIGRLPQNLGSHADALIIGTGAEDITGVFAASTAVTLGQILVVSSMVLVVIEAGTTSGTPPDPFTVTGYYRGTIPYCESGTAKFYAMYNVAASFEAALYGASAFGFEHAVALGLEAKAAGADSVAIGHGAMTLFGAGIAIGAAAKAPNGVAIGPGAIAWGARSLALGERAGLAGSGDLSIALGREASASADKSVAIGEYAHTERNYQLNLTSHMTLGRDNWTAGSGSEKNAGAESAFSSHYLELGTPQTWAASTSYTDGDVVQPTTPNGYQYHLWHGTYDPSSLPNTMTSWSSQPTWPTSIGGLVEADNPAVGNHYWIAADLATGVDETIPLGMVFYPTEIGFICDSYASVTAAPYVSIGTAASPTLLVNNQQLSTITGTNQRHAFTGFKHGITDLRIRLITAATGTNARFHGRFYAKGFFSHTQG